MISKLLYKPRKIDFMVIGSQKSGTTALDHYLRQHDDIGMPTKQKELHFFDNEKYFRWYRPMPYRNYEKHFDFTKKHKIYGEITPSYLYWIPSCERIKEYNPDIKMIAILRNPIDRAFSHWNMQFDRGRETLPFIEAVKAEPDRLSKYHPLQDRQLSYVDRGYYSGQIKRFFNTFAPSQLLIIKYEEFRSRQLDTLHRILEFLQVSVDGLNFEEKVVHKRPVHAQITSDEREYLIDLYRDDVHELERLLGWDCSDWLSL